LLFCLLESVKFILNLNIIKSYLIVDNISTIPAYRPEFR